LGIEVICGSHNRDHSKTLVGHPYAGGLKPNKHSLLVDVTKSPIKPTNILLNLN